MFMPRLTAWVKQGCVLLGKRVKCVGLDTFIAITPGTRQTEIVLSRGSILSQRCDVFHVHLCATNHLCGMTISTPLTIKLLNLATTFG